MKKVYILLGCLILLSVLLRIILFSFFAENNSIEYWEYDTIAKNVISGNGFTITHLGTEYKSYTSPFCPLLIAALYKIFGITIIPVIFLQIILSVATAVIIFMITRCIFKDGRIAVIAFILCLFNPGLVLYSAKKIHSLSLDTFMFSLATFFTIQLRRRPLLRNAALLGIIFGAACLSRFSAIVFFPAAILWLFIVLKKRLSVKVLYCITITAVMMIMLSSWAIRNYVVHKKIIFSATVDSEVFWRGNSEHATGASFTLARRPVLLEDKAFYSGLTGYSELEQRDIFKRESTYFIKTNPKMFIKLFLRKFYYFWWFSPVSGFLYPPVYMHIYKYFYGALAVCALLGIHGVLTKKIMADVPNFTLLILFLLSISLFQSLFYVEGRHRLAVEPLIFIISSAAIGNLFFKRRKAREKGLNK